MMRKRILSILLCLVMVVGLFPTMAFAADGSGATTGRGTKSDPYCVSTYAEMKRLLEKPASSYIKVVGMDNDSDNVGVPIRRLIAGRDFESTEPAIDIPYGANHHLEIATNIWFVADPLDEDKNIFGRLIDLERGSSLEITGTGSLRVEVNALTVKNAIIDNWGGELTIDGSVTLNGIQDFTTNVATRPIWIDGGVTNIKGGYIYGHNNMKTTSDAVTSAISFGNNLADGTELNISGGTIKQVNNSTNQGNENSCALYVDDDKAANAIHLTGGIFEGGMKMKTDKPLSNLLSAGYQFYDMSANAFFDGSVSKTQKKLTVTPTGVNPTVIDKVSLNIKSLNKRKTLSDLECGYDPSSKMTLTDFVVCKGLNNTTDKIEGKNTPYDPHQDYTAMYTFEARPSYSFADTVENQVSVSGGDFWKADILGGSTKKLCVFVNFPSNQVKEVSMTMNSKGDFKTIEDLKCQSFVPDDKLELVNQMFFAGLKDTSNEHQIEDLKTAYQPAADYTGVYVFKLKPGFSFAQDITDLAKKHVTISEGEIYNVDTMKNKDGAMLLRVFVSFEGTGSSISNVHLNFKPVGVRHQIADMRPVNWTPGEETLKLDNVCYYDGADTDDNAHKLTNIEAAYDRNKAYSVSFQLIGEMGAVFADGFDKNSITLSDGKVWKVQRIDKNKMVICVTFPASGDTATKINAINLTIKPYDQRHALADFVPTAITPEGMSVTSTNIYKDGTLYTGSYDANTAYSVGYSLNTKSGYAFENGFEKENVTVSNGTVQSVNVINNNYVIVYVDFPVTGPTTYAVTVTSGGNGSASASPATAVFGTEIKLTANADSSYHFKEWQVVKGGVTVKDNKFKMPAGDVEIKAVFEKDAPAEYTVKFDGNGGKASKDEMTTNNQKLAKLPDATRSGKYQFDGWYMKKDGGTKITTATVFDKNTTVYAHWTYTGGGSSGGGGGSSVTTYAITVKSAKNGGVTASHKSAAKDTAVTLTVTPDKGYVLDTLTVLDSKDKAVKLTEKNGKYTFTMPAGKVTVSAAFKAAAPASENPFTDVPSGAYYEDAVIWAVKKDITSGTSATTFNPDGSCTRAQAVTFLWRAAGSPEPKSAAMPFTDVPAGSYFEKAVLWAVENGITKGTSDTTFSPDASCTRAQIVPFLWRAGGSPAVSGNSAFSDVASDAYYAAAVAWAEKNGVTGGIGGGLFGSDNTCTRAQIVTFLHRAMK